MASKADKKYTQDQVDLALMAADLEAVKNTVTAINHKLDANYVTKEELKVFILQLEILQKIVYGIVGVVLSTVLGGALVFYINAPK